MKAILDLDTGIDDALALAYAIAHPDLDLIGVTCTYGNVTVPLAVRNTLALLELLGQDDIPVFAGPSPDGFRPSEISSLIHGHNGVGRSCFRRQPPRRSPNLRPISSSRPCTSTAMM